jgi:hypothetical protein
MRESTSAGLQALFRLMWTRYASLLPPPLNINNPDMKFKVAINLQTTYFRSQRHQQPPRSPRPPPGGLTPCLLGPAAYMPSMSPQPIAAPPINSPVLKGSILVDDLLVPFTALR